MKEKIIIPQGVFEGNCSDDCIYANFRDRDNQGRVKCEGGYGGYNHPENRNGCFYYERR
ncbi:MAG: hypothetical protein Q4E24_01650 [bacterium]|nr:hypothetical protein [bacterium]